ncbi:MAG: recombination regulator RecX [Candidatus Chlorobium antarcticum]|jgi:regulatory protein|nr:recombination regulator RecX [Candidatus Chlorobium antarcticum]
MKERTPPTPGETMMLAFKLLGLRNHSIAELEKKLLTKGCPAENTAAALQRLKKRGMLDDRVFGEEFIRGRLKRRPAGTMKLRAELRKKGMPDTVIEELLESYDGMQGALAAAEKKMASLQRFTLAVRKKKLEVFLHNRGFGWQEIRNAEKKMLGGFTDEEPSAYYGEDYE